MTRRIQDLALSGLFIALGVLLPIFFHAVGLGKVFLPMFFPIAAGAFYLPLPFALAAAAITPLLSFILTGMPPVPDLTVMIFELPVLAGFLSLLSSRTRFGSFWKLAAGLLVWRFAGFPVSGLL